jgi:predicted ATP-grasp superfamily ATP-dependent carboligase
MDSADSTPSAIVTDGLWRKSLSAVRSLGKAGYRVTVLGESVFTTAFWSRYCARRARAPEAARDAEGFGRALLEELGRAGGRPVLLPMEDATLEWVSAHRDAVAARADLLVPPPEALRAAQDKGLTLRLARELGIACPETREPVGEDDFAKLAAELEPGTWVAKPRTGRGSAGVAYGDPRGPERWREHWRKHGPLLVQERIPPAGRALGVSVLIDSGGGCAAAFAHERLQQYPNSGGPSTDRVSRHEPALVAESLRLLNRLGWRGVAMVEWKTHPEDGRPRLMEINPRFWGSLELAVRAGIDFPALYARAARGERLPPAADYPDGVRCRWMVPGEILRYLTQPGARREGLGAFLRGLPAAAEEWDPTDLRGALATAACTAALALSPRYWAYLRRG